MVNAEAGYVWLALRRCRFVELGFIFIFVYWTLNLSLSLAHATVLYLRRVDTEQIIVAVSALVTIRIETVYIISDER